MDAAAGVGGAGDTHAEGGDAPWHIRAELLIRAHWYQLFIVALALYALYHWAEDKFESWRSRRHIRAKDPQRLETLEERMAAARARQAAHAAASAVRDRELREEKALAQLEAMRQREDEIQQRAPRDPALGRALGAGTGGPKKAPQRGLGCDDGEEEEGRGPRKKLPKLPGGPAEHHESFPSSSSAGGGGATGGRFRRSCGPKGG